MNSHDYTKEINVISPERIIPWRYAALLLTVLAVVAWFGIRSLVNHTTLSHSTHETVMPAAPNP